MRPGEGEGKHMEWASRNGGEHIRGRSCGGILSPSHAVSVSVGCSVDFS